MQLNTRIQPGVRHEVVPRYRKGRELTGKFVTVSLVERPSRNCDLATGATQEPRAPANIRYSEYGIALLVSGAQGS